MAGLDKQPVKEPGVFVQVVQGFNQSIRNLGADLEAHGQLLDAIVELSGGPEVVGKKLAEIDERNAKANAEIEAAAVSKALVEGQLKVVDTISEISVVVFEQTRLGAEAGIPRRVQLGFKNINPGVSKDLLGKRVGESVTMDDKFQYTVKEIYEGIPQTTPPPTEVPPTETGAV
jgi:hypothetical protein